MLSERIWLGKLSITHKSQPRSSNFYQFEGTLCVFNESPNKSVGLHFEIGGVWHDVHANYQQFLLTDGGKRLELWKLSASFNSNVDQPTVRMAAFYRNLDWKSEHWDNNNGADYYVPVVHEA